MQRFHATRATSESAGVAVCEHASGLPWGTALSLAERLDLLRASEEAARLADPGAGVARLERWRSQPPFDHHGLFARKLATNEMDEPTLLDLLARPGADWEQMSDEAPDWLGVFARAYEVFADAPPVYSEHPDASIDFSVLLNLVNPLVAAGVDQLRHNLADLQPPGEQEDWLCAATVEGIWLRSLRGQLARMVARLGALEMGIARLEGRLVGDTPEERYQNFFTSLSDPERALAVWRKYPVLARQVTEFIQTRARVLVEFLAHLAADWDMLQVAFATRERLGPLADLSLNQGDSHGGGKGVILARFASGETVVYKPRSLSVEVCFQRLLGWLNDRGAELPFRILTVLDRDDHGWVEFVSHHGCADDGEVERFYHRQGAYLALFYALQANDFHSQNLIAAGEHPMAIDLETLFHPTAVRPNTHPVSRLVQRATDDSVMKVGLLPQRVWSKGDGEGIDISGIGGGTEQIAPDPTLCWAEPGTDQMHVTRDRFRMSSENNRPTLRQEDVSPYRFHHAIRDGFIGLYRLLLNHRAELLAPDGPLSWFANDAVRVVLRDTRTYAVLLDESYHPDFLRDALNRDRHFDRLWLRTVHHPHFSRVIEAEQRDLRAGDIPLFTTRPDSCDLWTSRGERIAGFFEQSGLACVRQRLTRLSEQDLGRQLWLIDASLATLGYRQGQTPIASLPRRQPAAPATSGQLLDAAVAVADRLEKLAIRDGELATWFGTRYLQDGWSVELVGLDLYDGLAGIALSLGYLGKVSGEHRITTLGQSAFATVEAYLREDYRAPSIGGFTGLGGILYALSHLGAMWSRPDLLDVAESLAARHVELLRADDQYDITAGAAGCIMGLLSLHAVRPSDVTLAAARRCGEHLLNAAQRAGATASWTAKNVATLPLAGFSHGAAGIAHALLSLFRAGGDRRFRDSALAAIEFERTLYCATQKNWVDRRELNGHRATSGQAFMTAWCHGAPGIGLARMRALGHGDDIAMRAEIDVALDATLNGGFGHNHSLCHGDLGNLEFLLEASRQQGGALDDRVGMIAASILESIERDGYRCGIPLAQQTPGLMNGLAGIGYGLLRLAVPERVPSVLTLDAPIVAR